MSDQRADRLPADGPATVAGIGLPTGRVVSNAGVRLAWISDAAVPDSGAVWRRLDDAAASSGLIPILIGPDDRSDATPGEDWTTTGLVAGDPTALDHLSAVDVLTVSGALHFHPARPFRGLAAAEFVPGDSAATDRLVAALPDARIALVDSPRGADALSSLGWNGNSSYDSTEAVAVVVRSWEDRFGARVVEVGPNSLTLGIDRPPRDAAQAGLLSDELVLVDPDLAGMHPGVAASPPTGMVALGDALIGCHFCTLWWS